MRKTVPVVVALLIGVAIGYFVRRPATAPGGVPEASVITVARPLTSAAAPLALSKERVDLTVYHALVGEAPEDAAGWVVTIRSAGRAVSYLGHRRTSD